MALPTSGTIYWDDIKAEFNAPDSALLTQMYRGGPYVPNIPQNAGVPTSGFITIRDFLGATNQAPFAISAADAHGAVFRNEPAPTTITVVAGTTINFSGGTGSGRTVTYAKVSGDNIQQIDTDTTPRWSATLFRNESLSAVFRATGRDSGGNVDIEDITVTLSYTTDL